MTSLRAISEAALATTLEGVWGADVTLTGPDGKQQSARGQVTHDVTEEDPATGATIFVYKSTVSLRRSSLSPIPVDGEDWAVTVPLDPTASSDTQTMAVEKSSKGGRTIGFITLYLTNTEQS